MEPELEPLPAPIEALSDRLAGMPGARAVVLGGSRGTGAHDARSDWDLGVYYRGRLDFSALAELGEVHPPGRWGRIMNGGAWLSLAGEKVDVILRDLDVVEHWCARAEEGDYEIDALLGYAAGLPTYSLRAELVTCRTLRGEVARPTGFPPALAREGLRRWRFHRDFTLHHAHMRADRGDVVGAVAQAAKAAIEAAHAALCARETWVLNEKRIVERAGLGQVHALFSGIPQDAVGLRAWVERVEQVLAPI
jgi:hypothetical protein